MDSQTQDTIHSSYDKNSEQLTPSSSDTTVSTAVARSSQRSCTVMPKVITLSKEPTTTPYLTLKRQPTAAMINFRARKSVSQMDFKEARRTGNYKMVAYVPPPSKDVQTVSADGHDAALIRVAPEGQISFVVQPDQDYRWASLQISNSVIIKCWRNRRLEIRNLRQQLEDQKKILTKTRNQLHLYTSLYAVEQRSNSTLNDQLQQANRNAADAKVYYRELYLKL